MAAKIQSPAESSSMEVNVIQWSCCKWGRTDIAALAGRFGKSVPPALARYDMAPDPPDHVVDITDIARMAGFFGHHCTSP